VSCCLPCPEIIPSPALIDELDEIDAHLELSREIQPCILTSGPPRSGRPPYRPFNYVGRSIHHQCQVGSNPGRGASIGYFRRFERGARVWSAEFGALPLPPLAEALPAMRAIQDPGVATTAQLLCERQVVIGQPGRFENGLTVWTGIASPHLLPVFDAMVRAHLVPKITVVIGTPMTQHRLDVGWNPYEGNHLEIVPVEGHSSRSLLAKYAANRINVFSGLNSPWLHGLRAACGNVPLPHSFVVSERPRVTGRYGRTRRARYRLLYRRVRQYVNGVFAIGVDAMDIFTDLGVPSSQLVEFGYFPELTEFYASDRRVSNVTPPRDSLHVIFVGRHVEAKGGSTLLTSLSKMRECRWRATFVGDGPSRGDWQKLAVGSPR
jgi:hypothetical protein